MTVKVVDGDGVHLKKLAKPVPNGKRSREGHSGGTRVLPPHPDPVEPVGEPMLEGPADGDHNDSSDLDGQPSEAEADSAGSPHESDFDVPPPPMAAPPTPSSSSDPEMSELPPEVAVPRAAPGENSEPFGPFIVSKVFRRGVQVGWGATCGKHRDPDFPDRVCKLNRVYGGLTDDQLVLGLKRWLVLGHAINNLDDGPPGPKTRHMAVDVRALAMKPVDASDDPDYDVHVLWPDS